MRGNTIKRHDFEAEFPVPADIKKDKLEFEKRSNGYILRYNDEKEYKDGDVTGFSSYSMSISESYGDRDVEDANMEFNDGKIKITGSFGNKMR